jgi:hypothetical protein
MDLDITPHDVDNIPDVGVLSDNDDGELSSPRFGCESDTTGDDFHSAYGGSMFESAASTFHLASSSMTQKGTSFPPPPFHPGSPLSPLSHLEGPAIVPTDSCDPSFDIEQLDATGLNSLCISIIVEQGVVFFSSSKILIL